MLKSILFSIVIAFAAVQPAAASTYTLDGSAAICESKVDLESKAFRLSVEVDATGLQFLKIVNLVCQKSQRSFGWIQRALGSESTFETDLGVIKTTVTKASLQITDFEGYNELQMINLDVGLTEQTILLSDKVTQYDKVVGTLRTYQRTTLNGVLQDEGFNSNGSILIKLK